MEMQGDKALGTPEAIAARKALTILDDDGTARPMSWAEIQADSDALDTLTTLGDPTGLATNNKAAAEKQRAVQTATAFVGHVARSVGGGNVGKDKN